MFRFIAILGFLITFIWLALTLRKNQVLTIQWFVSHKNNVQDTLKDIKKSSVQVIIKNLLFPLIIICIVILSVTGFFSVIILGKPISTYLLLLHVSMAPIFAICMAILSLIWTHKHSFNKADWQTICNLKSSGKKNQIVLWQKVSFWLIIFLTLPIILSILLSMYPLFGSGIQNSLLITHRYSTLLFMILSILYFYFSIIKDKTFFKQKLTGEK